ncbi:MAG: hypothetical protein ACI3YK_02745 [Eubacteriales bacterium]
MTRKILSTVMCFLLVASTLIVTSCADNGATNGTTSNQGGTTPGDTSSGSDVPTYSPDFSDCSDEERTITFAFCEGAQDDFTARSISVDELGDDDVDNAIYTRNKTIEAQLGVFIDSYQAGTSIQGLEDAIGISVSQGDPEFDVIVGYQYYDIIMATKAYVDNLAELKDDNGQRIEYLDYTKDYWGTDYIEALSYNDIVYWVTGDLSLRFVGGVYCTYVNETLYQQYCYETYGSIYDIVKNNQWTMDLLAEMATKCYSDGAISGDVNQTVDDGDIVGYAWEPNDPIDGLAFGCKVPFSTRSSDGSITLTLASSARTVNFVTALEKVLYGTSSLQVTDDDSKTVMPFFASGQSLFTVNKLFQAERYLQDMSDNYYIIPTPMLDATQGGYVTGIHDGCSIYGITYGSDCKPAAAATLEWMAYLSHRDVLPKYYDVALKNKYTNDQASAEMIDIIHDNVNTDFAAAWSASISDLVHWFRTNNKSTRFVSTLQRYTETHNAALEKLLNDLEEAAMLD